MHTYTHMHIYPCQNWRRTASSPAPLSLWCPCFPGVTSLCGLRWCRSGSWASPWDPGAAHHLRRTGTLGSQVDPFWSFEFPSQTTKIVVATAGDGDSDSVAVVAVAVAAAAIGVVAVGVGVGV